MVHLNSQKFFTRKRAPRVQLEYEIELYGAEKKVELPFIMGVMADLSGRPDEPLPKMKDRKFIEINRDNFDWVLERIRPRLAFRVDNKLTDNDTKMAVELRFKSMDDFHPERIANQVYPLHKLVETRQRLSDLLSKMDGNDKLEELLQDVMASTEKIEQLVKDAGVEKSAAAEADQEETTLLDQIIDEGKMALDANHRGIAKDLLGEFVSQIMEGVMVVSKDTETMINSRIGQIDKLISAQLNEIMHQEDFQKLEGSWRGLFYLVENTESDEMLKIRVMNISKKELLKDLEKASEWDQSSISKKIYVEEYATVGGQPYGCLVGDYYFGNHPADLSLLEKMAQICAAAHCPFIAGASPEVMNMDTWLDLPMPRDLSKIFQSVEYAKWRSLRDAEDSRYTYLTLPRFLGRLPYNIKTSPVSEFHFEEDTAGMDHRNFCWINSAYAMAANVSRAFKLYGWCARICGIESGGVIEGLPAHTLSTDDGWSEEIGPTEINIADNREQELANNGFMALVHRKNTEMAAFISAQSLNKPKLFDTQEATANAEILTRLAYILAVSRFAHYLKCIVRDKIGSFKTPTDAEAYLNRWINRYVEPDPFASEVAKARRPLARAEVEVEEVESKPGYFSSKLFLLPRYHMEGLTAAIQLVW